MSRLELAQVRYPRALQKAKTRSQEVGSLQLGTPPDRTIDAWFANGRGERRLSFILGGRAWEVSGINRRAGICTVKPAKTGTFPRWLGRPSLLSRTLCQSMRAVLVDREVDPKWSKRAQSVISGLRESYGFLRDNKSPLITESNRICWWTFTGGKANTVLAALLEAKLHERVRSDNLCVSFMSRATGVAAISQEIHGLAGTITDEQAHQLQSDSDSSRLSKLSPCLPKVVQKEMNAHYSSDLAGASQAVALFS